MNIEAPVLLIIFNRPDTLKTVFDIIRKVKPSKLYISADGPRLGNEGDKINCEKAREIVRNIDWECEIHHRFLDENLGCGFGPSSAISWAFESEDRLIIIEDDCIPSLSLFEYHNLLLEKFKNDNRVWMISGQSNHENSKFFDKHDYIFSHYGRSMGWSTWKRCWDYFDIEMKGISEFIKNGESKNILFSKKEYDFINSLYTMLSKETKLKEHSWDIQFGFSILSNNGLVIVPAKNLAKHIGYIGTHYSGKESALFEQYVDDDFKIVKAPSFVLANREYDLFHFNNYIKKIMAKKPIHKRIINRCLKNIGLR